MSRRFPTDPLTADSRFVAVDRQGSQPSYVPPQPTFDTVPVRRFAVFTPEGYEPNYAYPLVVWLHGAGEDERVLRRLLPEVSDRNIVGLALRGDSSCPGGFTWSGSDVEQRLARLAATVRFVRRQHHVHSERIILAGCGVGAETASEMFFARPEWFGGLAVFDSPPAVGSIALTSREDLAGKPVLLDLPLELLGRGRDAAGRLAACGLDVTFRHSRLGSMDRDSLRGLNRWLMGAVCGVSV